MSRVPEHLRYTEDHLWLQTLEDGSVRVGITDFAQEKLGDVVYVELPEVGETYPEHAECAVVESVKSASDIPCPVSGEVLTVNETLSDSPETVNQDPYGTGWLFRLQPDDISDLDDLLDAEGYLTLIAGEE